MSTLEKCHQIRAIATEIAAHLPEGWDVKPWPDDQDYHWSTWITGPGGAELMVQQGDRYQQMKRVAISTCFPSGHQKRDDGQQITAAIDRGGEAIARDVARRILPEYLPALERAQLAKADWDADADRLRAVRDELVAIVPSSHVISWADTDTRSSISVGGKHWAKLDVSTGGRTGDLELRGVPTELLRVLLVAIAQTTGSRPADWPDKHLWLPDASGLACVACGDDEGANDHLQPEDPAHVWMDLEGLTAGDVDRLSGLGEGYGVQLVLDWIAEGGDFRDHYAPRELRIRARQAEKVAA